MKTRSVTRRAFLRGAGGAALALPLLESFATPAFGQSAPTYPKRFIVFQHPQGMIMDAWSPIGTGGNFQLGSILAPLESYKSKLVVVSGVDNVVSRVNALSNGHNSAARTLLTCMPYAENLDANGAVKPAAQQVPDGEVGGPSVDRVLARRISTETRLSSLDLGVGGTRTGEVQIFSAGLADPVSSDRDPHVVFDRLFGGLTPPEASAQPTTRERLRAKRRSVLDAVAQSFDALRGRVSAADRVRLDAHADKIRELERRLGTDGTGGSGGAPSCRAPTLSLPAGYRFDQESFDDKTSSALMDELVLALACDMTRVATFQYFNYQTPRFGWLGVDVPGRWDNWHAMIHEARNAGGRPAMLRVMTWYAEQFAYLLRRLAEIPEGDGTMLDHTLVLWLSDFGEGQAHRTSDLPIVLAGGLSGALSTGRHLDAQGRTTGDLFTSILNLFGFDDRSFGLRDYCSGPISGLA